MRPLAIIPGGGGAICAKNIPRTSARETMPLAPMF
jgi:hypothetical protein